MAFLHLDAAVKGWDSHTREDDKEGRRYQTFTCEGSDHMIEHYYELKKQGFEWSGFRLTTWAWGCPDGDGVPCCFTYRIGTRSTLKDMLVSDIATVLPTLHIKRKTEL